MSAGSRLQMHAFWQMVKFLLEGLVFLVVGLQLRDDPRRPRHARPAQVVAITAAVVLPRSSWAGSSGCSRRRTCPGWIPRIRRRDPGPPWSIPTVIGWAGMRGVVTLATALALPRHRWRRRRRTRGQLFVWLAFAVIVVTLVLQGTTLPLVARLVRSPPTDDPMRDNLAEAQVQNQASRAARARLDEQADGAPARGGRAAAPAHRGPHQRGVGAARRRRRRRRRGRTSGCAGRCSTPSGRCSGSPATRGASRRRCWCARSASWTWKSRCWNGARTR